MKCQAAASPGEKLAKVCATESGVLRVDKLFQ